MSKLEQAKAVLMEDKDAAAAEHTAAIGRINTHTSKIFAVFKRDLYLTMGGCGAQALPYLLMHVGFGNSGTGGGLISFLGKSGIVYGKLVTLWLIWVLYGQK